MSTEEQARELATKERQHEEHLQESMLNRAVAEVNHPSTDALTPDHARELAVKQRQHEEQLKESMLNRAKAEMMASNDTADSSAQ